MPVKWLVKKIPIAFTKNQQYDKQTRQIIKKVCHSKSNCIDVGTHKGEILDLFIKQSPAGTHFGFEPLPHLFKNLKKKYQKSANIHLFQYALADKNGSAEFNYVISNPAYSGLLKRRYDRPNEEDTKINVEIRMLDDIIPADKKIDLIKMDVEGGEINVLKGAVKTINVSKPVIIFEFGLGGSHLYGATPEIVFNFFHNYGYHISLLKDFLNHRTPLSLFELDKVYNNETEYYFVAFPYNYNNIS